MAWYYTNTASDAYKVWGYKDTHTDNTYGNYTQKTTLELTTDKLYVCRYDEISSYDWRVYWTNFWVEIEYPDMTTLY